MTESVTFRVHGIPRSQGSMRTVRNPKTGKPMQTHSSKLKEWRTTVGWYAQRELKGRKFAAGVRATMVFMFERPKSHYRTGKFSHLLKDSAPDDHIQYPDIDKLERAILDALTGVAYSDDAQVCAVGKSKRWVPRGHLPGLEITLRGVCA